MGHTNTNWTLRKRPSQEHIPKMIRKIWLARECFDESKAGVQEHSEQHVAFCGKEVCVLHGREPLRIRLHPSLPAIEGEMRAINLIRRVWFDVPFEVPPSVSLHLPVHVPGCRLKATDITGDGFDISAEVSRCHDVEEIVVTWKSVGFSIAIPDAEIVDARTS
ncbi:hypothetical protein [Celeribacter baekdonensis]|nr:hypothetical protein [Celeribacter baekdonensis]